MSLTQSQTLCLEKWVITGVCLCAEPITVNSTYLEMKDCGGRYKGLIRLKVQLNFSTHLRRTND